MGKLGVSLFGWEGRKRRSRNGFEGTTKKFGGQVKATMSLSGNVSLVNKLRLHLLNKMGFKTYIQTTPYDRTNSLLECASYSIADNSS